MLPVVVVLFVCMARGGAGLVLILALAGGHCLYLCTRTWSCGGAGAGRAAARLVRL